MQMKQPTAVKEAKSMVKERWLDHRVDKLSRENDQLREAVRAFETTHPTLTSAINGVADALAKMGI